MSLRKPFSELKKKLKHRLAGGGRESESGIGAVNTGGERVDGAGSLPQPESRLTAKGSHNSLQAGNKVDVDGRGVSSTDPLPQLDDPGSAPVSGSGQNRGGREVVTEGREPGERDPYFRSGVEGVVESGRNKAYGEKIDRVDTSPSEDELGGSAVADHVQQVLGANEGEPGAADENGLDWNSTASGMAKSILRTVKESSNAYPPLKSIAEHLYFILNNCEHTEVNEQVIESLAPRVKALSESLREPIPPGDVSEKERARKLERKLEEALRELTPLVEKVEVAGFLNDAGNAQEFNSLVEDVHEAVMNYQTSLQQDIYDEGCLLIEPTDLALLDRMRHATDAGYLCGNRQGCLRGTRRDILLQIERWSTEEQDQRIFWLNGLAGTGKSTIAQTFAEISFADGRLGASFFCSRDFEDRSDLQIIFPTLAFQLAHRYSLFREKLLQVLRANPDVGRESLCSQMEKLIVGPLKTAYIPTLIIIDALDECKDEEPASAILSVLSRYVDEIPRVKFFITGRPEPRIRSGFRLKSLRPITEVLRLHDVKRSLVDSDIKLFFRTQLGNVAEARSDCSLTEDWPSSSAINILCKKAEGLFIYASTVVKFIASEYHIPADRLNLIISLPQSTTHEGKSGIDLLYTQVLEHAFHGVHVDGEEFYPHLRSVLGALLLIFNPLPMEALSTLLKKSGISTTLRFLHSLLLVPDNEANSIHVFHKSLPDFLMDPERCKDKRFFINPSVHHHEILLSCLKLMKEGLKKNICSLDDYVILSRIEDTSICRKEHIGDALEYACQFWARHLVGIPSSICDFKEVCMAIDEFFTTCLLFWIEVLAIMGCLDLSVYAIDTVQQWYISAGLICKWTDDSRRFILEYFDLLRISPSQIYHSALPLSPSQSWLHECYSSEFAQEVKVVKELQADWGACSRVVTSNRRPVTLAHWKDIVAIGSLSGKITILDAIPGIHTSVLSDHTDKVNSLAFSLDGMFLVSGSSDKTVVLWDMQTGGVIRTFYGHAGSVLSVSISMHCTIIASGSADKTICLWNAETRECYCIIDGHSGQINSVSFSPTNPQLLISGSSDNSIQQWDIDGYQIGPTYDGCHSAFSLDGAYFVSWMGRDATVWDFNSGIAVNKLQVFSGDFDCCCFSPNGKFLAGGVGVIIYVWDITRSDPHLTETLVGHTSHIISLAFSSSLISLSLDESIRLWQIDTSIDPAATELGSKALTSASIKSITLQASDGIAVLSDSAGVVRAWDIFTGLCRTSFQTQAQISGRTDTRIIDDRLIFAWCPGKTIHIWDAKKGEQSINVLHSSSAISFRISGDGSKVFLLSDRNIQAWSIWTGELIGTVWFEDSLYPDSLIVENSKVWVNSKDLQTHGWNFGIPGPAPIPLSSTPPQHKPQSHLNFINYTRGVFTYTPRVVDAVTHNEVFWLHGRYARPTHTQWDGHYLVAGYDSGEVVILDFKYVIPR